MVLELNEYIRTKGGIIAKVIGVQSGGIEKYYFDKEVIDNFKELTQIGAENVVLKHSFNIIDLIEEGDFVNGIRVEYVYRPEGTYVKYIVINENHLIGSNDDIKSIVTKEQMKTIEYEVS